MGNIKVEIEIHMCREAEDKERVKKTNTEGGRDVKKYPF